jgi:hypothetical protein
MSSSYGLPVVGPSSSVTNTVDSEHHPPSNLDRDVAQPREPGLLNFLAFLYAQRIPLVFPPNYNVDVGSQVMSGVSMEVRFGSYKGDVVAVKRIRSSNNEAEGMRDLLFELKVMTHESIRQSPNVANLLAVSIEINDDNPAQFEPILIVEAADRNTPDLKEFFRVFSEANRQDHKLLAGIVADIADGLHVLHRHRLVHSYATPP